MKRVFGIVGLLLVTAASAIAEPINRYCPIGKESIQKSAGTITYQGREIGFCCPGCDDMFLAWDDKRKAEFVALALAKKEPHDDKPAVTSEPVAAPTLVSIHPFPLNTCAVSGEELGDDAQVREYDGREVKFCCKRCAAKYEANPSQYNESIDEQIKTAQRVGYPLTTCPLSGASFFKEGKFTGVEVVHKNRLVRFCCNGCAGKFTANPAPVFAKLDAAIVAQQSAAYPLSTCVVGGDSIKADSKPVNLIYANRLYKLCCASCTNGFAKNPSKYVQALDVAYAKALRAAPPLQTCAISGEALDGDAIEVVAGSKLYRFCCDRCAGKFRANPDMLAGKISD